MENNVVIELNNVCKEYKTKNNEVKALKNISLTFEKGKFYAIRGHSGSGKSTLINIIGLLESITSGTYKIKGKATTNLKESEEAELRRKYIGFIFQDFFLDEKLKAYENVMIPMFVNPIIKSNDIKSRALELLNLVGLDDRTTHYPKELSGGEQQRVAIARALANDPEIIIADEPTGNLDEENETKIFKILKELSRRGKCVIVVTHSNEVIDYADKVYFLKAGELSEE